MGASPPVRHSMDAPCEDSISVYSAPVALPAYSLRIASPGGSRRSARNGCAPMQAVWAQALRSGIRWTHHARTRSPSTRRLWLRLPTHFVSRHRTACAVPLEMAALPCKRYGRKPSGPALNGRSMRGFDFRLLGACGFTCLLTSYRGTGRLAPFR